MSSKRVYRVRFVLLIAALATLAVWLQPLGAQTPPPTVSINDVAGNEGNSGTTSFTFTATLSNPPSGNFTIMVNYATANGTAMAGACTSGFDYATASGQVTFNRNQLTRPVTVSVCGDTAVELDEMFFVDLSNAPPGTVIVKPRGIGTIVNDDVAPIRPTATNVSCTPGTVPVGGTTTCTATVTDTGTGSPTTPQGTATFSLESDPDGDSGTFVPVTCTLTGGSGASNSCSVSYGPTARGDGTHAIGATYTPAGSTHSGSTDPTPFLLTVQARTTSTTVACPASTPANSPTTCTVTVRDTDSGTKSAPAGTVDLEFTGQPSGSTATVTPDSCVLAPNGDGESSSCPGGVQFTANTVGSYTIKGTYQPAAASVHASSFGSDTITVTARTTSTTVECPPSTPANTPATCTVQVTDMDTAPRSPPAGTVDFSFTSQPSGSTATVAPDPCLLTPDATTPATDDSACIVTFTADTVGNYTIRGTYAPALASVHAASSGTDTIQVTLRTTSTTVECTPNTFQAGDSTTCTAIVTDTDAAPRTAPTGTVTWSSSESTGIFTPNPCALGPNLSTPDTDDSICTVTYSSTKASQQTITANYDGGPIHETSSNTTTVTVEPGPPASVILAPPTAVNDVDTQHCVTATVTDRFGNPTPGITVVFSVTGSNTASGTDTTDADGKAEFCYTGVLIGIVDVIRAFADFAPENGAEDPGEPFGTATKVWTIPPSTAFCEVTITQGGWIVAQNGDRASFGGNANVSSAGEPSGQQEYQDHGPVQPMNVKSTEILAVLCTGNQATIFGLATVDGSGEFAYRIDLVDAGEPASGQDRYRMRIAAYDSGDQPLQGGNVQVHKP